MLPHFSVWHTIRGKIAVGTGLFLVMLLLLGGIASYDLRRIDKAKYLLTSTPLSVKEIAYATGYNSEENFIHSFRSNVGIAPGLFRKYPI